MRKNCSSDREKLLKFEAEGREFATFLRSLEQFFLTVGQNNSGNKIPFLNLDRKKIGTLLFASRIGFTEKSILCFSYAHCALIESTTIH